MLASLEARYAKPICHLNNAQNQKRLGLILGSGVSVDLGIPRWQDLIVRIEQHQKYASGVAPESYRAEQLFQHYKSGRKKELVGWTGKKIDAAVMSGWRGVVAECLYSDFKGPDGAPDAAIYQKKIEEHKYLKQLGKVAQLAAFIATHNFDDALEFAIDLDGSSRRHQSFWKPEPFPLVGVTRIYHPNGYTPLRPGLKGSDDLILTEASFADHLVNVHTEESQYLLRHLADKTCLIIGHSLSDATLKNALRQHANLRPGHVNYYVHWHKEGESGLDEDQRNAIREANFETYNLVTIFASSEDIGHLLTLVAKTDQELKDHFAMQSLEYRYVYYFVGSVSSGKSTTLRHLRDLVTVEEWPRNMPPIMNKPSVGLEKPQESEIDVGLEDAIWKKNEQIGDVKVGIVAVDRAPLDFIAFPSKVDDTLGATARDRGNAVLKRLEMKELSELYPGQVIVVRADPEYLVERQLQRSNRAKVEEVQSGFMLKYLTHQRDRIASIYADAIAAGSVVDSDQCSIRVSVKAAARLIHFGQYTPFKFRERLRAIQGGA